ncbi:AraC family transcriptional regulator [Paenibacillus hodogayensis]|uniref:AraC family transcriptional regulator n=1 Tax=Paenibacillus hodogayensis TaxID=279208 RepID=A0ABV5VY74_9BACL
MREPDLAALAPRETLGKLEHSYFPPYVTLAHIFTAPREWRMDSRVLEQYVFEYVIGGKSEYVVEGSTYSLSKGDLLLYRPYDVHSARALPDSDYVSISIVFHFADNPFPFEELYRNEYYVGNFADRPAEQYLYELTAKYKQSGLHNRILCQGLLLLILSETSAGKKESKAPTGSQQKNLARMVQIKKHIVEHLDRDIDPAELEKRFGLTWNYIINQFNKTFGVTPVQFLTWARVAKAKQLALQTKMSFSEIAYSVGYKDVHTFGKMFKKKTSMSLTEFCASVCDHEYFVTWPEDAKPGARSRAGAPVG